MSNGQLKRGPVAGDLVRLDTKVTAELGHALDGLVTVTGQSKASLVRQALAQFLTERDALPPGHAEQIDATLTRGPGLAASKKEKP